MATEIVDTEKVNDAKQKAAKHYEWNKFDDVLRNGSIKEINKVVDLALVLYKRT